ncbi:MAG: hypothetical protein QF886_08455, partial [Planctomycetota bacterium]|nr:hypothetical protein [Planctomycetota bacterium]
CIGQMSLDCQVMFPNALLFLGMHPVKEMEIHLANAYNRWLVEHVLPSDPQVKAMLYLPFNSPTDAEETVKRFLGKPGVAGFLITSSRHKPVHANEYMRLYSMLEETGQVLGFHYVINHGVAKGQESDPNLIEPFVQPYNMKVHYSSHPNSWGNLQLLGTDGNLNILGPDGKPSERPIAEVSKVLGMQVIDPDSNTDTAIRNHMTLRVRNRVGFNGDTTSPDGRLLGDWEDLRLTETGRSTGIFEGWLKLTVLPSINGDGRLNAQSGDLLDISYNDFIKTAGEYNQKLAATVHVVAPVFSVEGGRKE